MEDLLNRTTISHNELESAVGFLSFAAKVVVLGRAFLRRLFDAIRRLTTTYRITYEMRADLLWWRTYLKDWDGLKLLRYMDSRPIWHVWTDVSGKLGIGGYILPSPDQIDVIRLEDVFSTRVATRHRHKDIQFKEIKAVLYTIYLWLARL